MSYIKRKFCLVVSRCNLIDCGWMCISFGIRIDLDIYLTGKKKISFQFYLLYICAISFNHILPEICFSNNLSLSWKQRNAYIFKKYEFSPVHIVSPRAVSKSFPYNLDIKSQTKVCVPWDLYRTLTSNGQFICVLVIEGNSFNCVLFFPQSQVKNQEAWVRSV